MKVKKNIKSLLTFFVTSAYDFLLKIKIIEPKVIVYIDGGISSQLYQYFIGLHFKEKGFKVRYDLKFYRENALDMNKIFARNFDLQKLFAGIEVKQVNVVVSFFYRNSYYYGGNFYEKNENYSFLNMKPPLYLGGYYKIPDKMWKSIPEKMQFKTSLFNDSFVGIMVNKIKTYENSIAVHVRRGDLSEYNIVYGEPATTDYFERAIMYCQDIFRNTFFYFFSDESQWIKEELIPSLPIENYEIVKENGSDKGYVDLFLIAQCKHQIASKGFFGKMGALLNHYDKKLLICMDDETEFEWKNRHPNVKFI
jgi:hypothetical protein